MNELPAPLADSITQHSLCRLRSMLDEADVIALAYYAAEDNPEKKAEAERWYARHRAEMVRLVVAEVLRRLLDSAPPYIPPAPVRSVAG